MNSVFLNDQQLADKGWEKMSSLLDKEMPQPRKRRPVFWWAAAVLTGAFLLYEYQGDRQDFLVAAPEPVASSTAATVVPQQEYPQITAPSTVDGQVNNAISNTIVQPAAGNAGRNNTKGISPAPLQISDLAQKDIYNTANTAGVQTSISDAENPGIVDKENTIAQAENLLTVQSPVNFDRRDLDRIPSPATAPTFTLQAPIVERMEYNKPAIKKVAKKHTASKATFGIMAGANAFQVKQVPGFVGGLTLDLIPRKRFGVQTGLLYRYQVFSGESRPVIPVSYDNYLRATSNYDIQPKDFPNSWIYLSANNSVLIPVLKSHQIEMPVLLFWQMDSRWRVYGGMTLLRHVWVKSAEKGLFTYDLKVVTTPDDDAAGNLNNIITGQLPAWEKNWQTGISFKPFKRLEVGVFYRSTWKGKPLISDVTSLFGKCSSCNDSYPEAAQRTGQSLRPRSLQLNATIKF